MAVAYRLIVERPTTATAGPRTFEWTGESGVVMSVEVDLQGGPKGSGKVSNLQAVLHDPKWTIANALPDPAYSNVPVKLYMAREGSPQATWLVFDGIATAYDVGYPAVSKLTIVAHDKSIGMRRQRLYKTFRNVTSVQLAKKLADYYGVDTDAVYDASQVKVRPVEIGTAPSDWDHLVRALAADGLTVSMDGGKLRIRQVASKVYPTVFRPDEPPVRSFNVRVEHIRGPGEGGGATTRPAFEDQNTKGSVKATAGKSAADAETTKAKATDRTHRQPIGLPSAEDGAGSPYVASVDLKRRRKDEGTLTCDPLPDLTMDHTITTDGWGPKFDGVWHLNSIKHAIIGQGVSSTSLSLSRPTSKGSADGVGIAFEDRGTKSAAKTRK